MRASIVVVALTSCAPFAPASTARQQVTRVTSPAHGRALAATPVDVVPRPRSETPEAGDLVWPRAATVALDARLRALGQPLRAALARDGLRATAIGPDRNRAKISIQLFHARDARLGDEGYVLRVRPDGIVASANGPAGAFYAVQTIEQLAHDGRARGRIAAVTIVDAPAYRWRGIQLDVARHYFSVPVVERFIDVAAHYKLNTVQLHLTDDEAWRLQSRRYAALGAGAARYSPADVRRIVAYAAARFVTVVPEIEMPAHAGAALRAYPSLACGHRALCTTGAGLRFAREMLAETLAAFPSRYVHVGGDEAPPAVAAQQPAFTRALAQFAAARGRRIVGWDEIDAAPLPAAAVVMAWRGERAAARALRSGNEVVLASWPLYFDAAQGDAAQEPRTPPHMATLEQVYAGGGMPARLSAAQRAHVLGVQGSLWTTYITTPARVFEMALPRELALAELAWTPRSRKSWDTFVARLPSQLAWLDRAGYPFRIPNASFALSGGPAVFDAIPGRVQSVTATTTASHVVVALRVPLAGAVVRYALGAVRPTAASAIYRAPFEVTVRAAPVNIGAAAFYHGRAGAVTECRIVRASPAAFARRRGGATSWSALVSP